MGLALLQCVFGRRARAVLLEADQRVGVAAPVARDHASLVGMVERGDAERFPQAELAQEVLEGLGVLRAAGADGADGVERVERDIVGLEVGCEVAEVTKRSRVLERRLPHGDA